MSNPELLDGSSLTQSLEDHCQGEKVRMVAKRITAVQRQTRSAAAEILDGQVANGPQIALGWDSLHVGPLGTNQGRGPCVYFVGLDRCDRHKAGFCSPCGFSCVSLPEMAEKEWLSVQFEEYQGMMTEWTSGITDVSNEGIWVPPFEKKLAPSGERAILVTGFIGSFFSSSELSQAGRNWLLEQFVTDFKRRELNPQVYIETRADDFLKAHQRGELGELFPLLQQLSARFIFGLESIDDFVRNGIYVKGLKLEDFEEAVRVARERGFGVNAFIFVGNHSMGEGEILDDVKGTLGYLANREITPVLMTPSLTQGSFNDLLRFVGRNGLVSSEIPVVDDYRFIDPRTFLALVRETMALFPFKPEIDHYPYMISLGGGPPEPLEWLFEAPGMATCSECAEIIKQASRRLLYDFNGEGFEAAIQPVDECPCRARYEKRLKEEESWPSLISRVTMNVETAEQYKEDYSRAIVANLEMD